MNPGFVFMLQTRWAFLIWGPDFRLLMSSVPGSIRAFSPSAPLICMSATVGKLEQKKIIDDLGITNLLVCSNLSGYFSF